jgi:para-aminobenzoate synthetase/4-amino-4-deoxychorismate lyase
MSAPGPSRAFDPAAVGTVVFGDGRAPDYAHPWRGAFARPRLVLRATSLAEVAPLVARADAEARAGAWAVLVLAYEAAPACDPALRVRPAGAGPLAWAAVYDAPLAADDTGPGVADAAGEAPTAVSASGAAPDWMAALDADAFAARLRDVQAHIAAGDTYQVNLTFPLCAPMTPAAAWAWFVAARARAHAPYAAWIAMGEQLVMSLSPELFVARQGTRLVTRPMKGTQARGRWPEEDDAARAALVTSDKARAENVMIVDLLRNDLGRLADIGSVRVTDLCAVEAYPTVWQLTSTIEAEVARDRPLWDVLQALFPCGSVTGAPKVRTMEVIAAAEVAPRGIYTGAIGLLRPGGDAVLSVPIRTIVLDTVAARATLGVGAGITADSVAADEYAECLLKSRFARRDAARYVPGLFETLRLEDGTFWLRARHLARLRASAALLHLPCDLPAAERALDGAASAHGGGPWRARLVLTADGMVHCSVSRHVDTHRPWRVTFASTPVDASDRRLFHKTLDRAIYDAARAACPHVDDVLLWNASGEVTETTIANLVVDLDGQRVTPPVSSGLLPGTFRADLLARGEICERILTKDDVRRATRVWLVNSLRGWMDAVLVD